MLKQFVFGLSSSVFHLQQGFFGIGIFAQCTHELVNLTTLSEEIEKAEADGKLEEVFSKHCNKRSEAIECVEKIATSMNLCSTQEERDRKVVLVNVAESIWEFICHENGSQIARE